MTAQLVYKIRQIRPGEWQALVGTQAQGAAAIPGGPIVGPGKPLAVASKGKSPSSALAKAAGAAKTIASNPILSAVLPPGTGAAISAVEALAKAAPLGKMKSVARTITGPGAKRLAKALKKLW